MNKRALMGSRVANRGWLRRSPVWALPVGLLAVVVILCALTACDAAGRRTPSPLPTAQPTALPTATPVRPLPTPSGRLPSVLTQVDMGIAPGNGYRPVAMALGPGNIAYVACQQCRLGQAGEEQQACVCCIDLGAGAVLDMWPLPGSSLGPMVAGEERLFVSYRDVAFADRLAVMDVQDGRLLADLDISYVSPQDGVWLDETRRRLYLPGVDGLEVRDALTLEVLAELTYPFRATDRRVLIDLVGDRLYVSLSNTLFAYTASELEPLWQATVPGERIIVLIQDVSKAFVVLQGAQGFDEVQHTIYFCDSGGELRGQFSPDWDTDFWRLAWANADAGRVVYEETIYPPGLPSQLCLWSSDLEGYPLGQELVMGGSAVLRGPCHRPALYLLGQSSHSLTVVDGANLDVVTSVQLGVELHDLVIDHDRRRLYVNDTSANLYEVDIAGLRAGKACRGRSVVAGAGDLTLDRLGGTLLAAGAPGAPGRVSVVDLDSLRVTQVITGGAEVALDTRRAHAIVGARTGMFSLLPGESQVWDLARREIVGRLPEGGPPAYNPLRDEIYLASYGCHVYDAGSLEYVGSLTEDIDAQSCKGCTGQDVITDVQVLPDLNLLVLYMGITSAGKGPGLLPGPRLFALDTLRPLTYPVTILPVLGGHLVWPPLGGRVYENLVYSRYVARANVVVREADTGKPISWRDGLRLDLIAPDGSLAYVACDDRWLALDIEDWTPVGYTERYAVHSYDPESDLFYALDGPVLYVLAPRWGKPEHGDAAEPVAPQSTVRSVQASPAYAQDQTVFAISTRGVFRSRDGAETWERLRGGLPGVEYEGDARLVLALSPEYARDGTLYVGGWGGGSRGFGVWRSADGGDSWQPVWRGLAHLQVEELALSPAFAQDGTLVAYCRYTDLLRGQVGRSVYRSSDRGDHWQLVDQVSQEDAFERDLPTPDSLFGETTRQSMRATADGRALERPGEGAEWTTVLKPPEGEYVLACAASPQYGNDGTVFALTGVALYRSQDAGDHWERAEGPLFAAQAFPRRFTDLAVALDAEGALLVFVADNEGGVTRLSPEELGWSRIP